MKRRRVIQALPLWLQPLACRLLIGHVYMIDQGAGEIRLACTVCPHTTVGVDVRTPAYTQTQPGDVRRRGGRRHFMTREPEPLPVDWFDEEHFQGEHARAL